MPGAAGTVDESSIVLSVGIPTYNGAASLGDTLECVLDQLQGGVEIVVSDNASSDHTAELVRDYRARSPYIRYFRNESNVGFDRNVDAVVRRSRGRFVWLLADDDLLREGAIARVTEIINKFPDVCEIYVDSLRPYANVPQDVLCVDANEFVELTAFRFGGLSSNVVNKATWEKKDLSAFIGSEWIHVAYVLNVVPEFASYVCNDSLKFEKPSLKRKRWDSGGAQFFRTGLKVVRVYRTMDPCVYSRAMRRRAVRGIRGGYLTAIPRAKALGLKVDGELLRELFGLYRNWPGFWFVDLPLLAVPNAVYRALLRAYRWGRA